MKLIKNPRTDVDVALLNAVFPDLLPDGREITHEQVEAVLKMNRAMNRYRAVTSRWRRNLLSERGVYLDGQLAQGRGFIVLTPDEMVRFGNRSVRTAGRKLRKAIAVVAAPKDEQLSENTRRYRQLLGAAIEKIEAENRSSIRAIGKSLAPMKQLPRAANE